MGVLRKEGLLEWLGELAQEGNGRMKELFDKFRRDIEEGQASYKIKDQQIAPLPREVEALTKERARLNGLLDTYQIANASLLKEIWRRERDNKVSLWVVAT